MPSPLHPRTQLSTESIFATMSRLAAQFGAINLGQGFPSNPPPDFLMAAARKAIGVFDQYTAPIGLLKLREALAEDLSVDTDQVVITCGGTEALHALAQALYGPGDEVVILEPYFDVYLPDAKLAGATPVLVPMKLEGGWRLDLEALERNISSRTRALLINSPNNPTGTIFSKSELERIVSLAKERDLWIISDEVYDELYFSGAPLSLRRLAPERTFTVGSAGKRLEATGWRVGWILTPAGLAPTLAGMRQWSSFCSPAPLQAAVAEALPFARQTGYYQTLREGYKKRRDLLASGLRALGFEVFLPQSTYFLTARKPGLEAETLVKDAKVAAIPGRAFYEQHPAPDGLMRFAFCKTENELTRAIERLDAYLKTAR